MTRATSHWILLSTVVLLAACSRSEAADATARPAPTDRPAAPVSYTLAGGARVGAAITDTISSRYGRTGDAFTAVVVEDVTNAYGSVVIPAGSMVHGTLVEVSPASNERSTGTLTLAVSGVTVRGNPYSLDASIDSLMTVDGTRGVERADVARVAGGAAVGAILGQVIGKDTKGTVIGAVAGAAAGVAVSALVKDVDVVLPAGARLMLTLRQPLTVTVN
jgi:hypothetical protein